MTDTHIHTEHSCDSDAKMYEYIQKAKAINVGHICFTDHVDFNSNDCGYGYYNPEKYFKDFNIAINNLHGNLIITSGIEFSEPHFYKMELEKLLKFPYDYVIGCIHWAGDMFPSRKILEKISLREYYNLYWIEVFRAVEAGGFDCLGHIDFPKRYLKEIIYDRSMINKIFTTMADKGIILEINTSSLRKGLTTAMPDKELLELYKQCRGKYVTIGSDAHNAEDLAADFGYAKNLIDEFDLQNVIFKERKMILV